MTRPLVGLVFLATALAAGSAPAQDNYRDRGSELLRQSRYAEAEEIFSDWERAHPNDPEAVFLLAVSRAMQGKTTAARAGFSRVLALDPRRADACFEMAGTFVKTEEYSQARAWALRGLRIAPHDEYGLELAGTAAYLAGAKDDALRYWNQLGRPHMTELRIVTNAEVSRQTVADEIGLAPGDLLSWTEIQKCRWRLAQHRYFRSVVFDPAPGETPDEYSLEVNANARRGVGTPLEFLFNTFGEVNFRTLRLDYWNIGGSTITLSTRWRWTPMARWLQAEASIPRLMHQPVYWTVGFDARDEQWQFTSPGSGFLLQTEQVTLRTAVPFRLPWASVTVGATGRSRVFLPEAAAPNTPDRVAQPSDLVTSGVLWLRAAPRVVIPAHQIQGDWALRAQVRAGLDGGWMRGGNGSAVSRLSLSPEIRIERTAGRRQALTVAASAGTLSKTGVAEDHFVLGVGPDVDYPLRAHPYLRDGHPGSAPLAGSFALANVTANSDIARWNWFKLGVQVFADCAWIERGYPGQELAGAPLVDTGAGLEFGSALSGSGRLTVVFGRDWQGRRNVLYVGMSLR